MNDPNSSDDAASRDASSSIEELSRIFDQIVDLPKDVQAAKLEELCPDLQVRQSVLALLDADTNDDRILDHSLFPETLGIRAGEQIGSYKLVEELGHGGMGVVFMAEQLEPVPRKVALKVIKPGVDTREVIARFDAERQALSLMDHPNIAKALDAGTTESGRPYFVMELVTGKPITGFCDENQLSIREQLELFLSVCHAIQHAHQKGIIHRDIKPSNVLVTEYDSRPVAKVIDFGVAKAIHQPLTEMTAFTGFGQIIGTFEYMSPEQSQVDQVDVDTRSDIYSLGVLLYELLTGSPPFRRDRLRSVAWEEMLRIIREEDPPKPSTCLLEKAQIQTRDRWNLHEPERLGRMVRDELDWIVMKAMEKDRNRRYETPNELANDIERFLNGDAVEACPPSAMYRFRKFAKRNKVALATSAVVAASLILGLIGTTWQAIRALRAEEATAVSVAEAQAVNEFLVDDLLGLAGAESQLSAGLRPDPNLRLITLLDRASARIDERFAKQPQIKAKLKATLASSFNSIGRSEDATPLYEDLLSYLKVNLGSRHVDTLRVMRQLGRAYIDISQLSAAEPLCNLALDTSRQELGGEHELTLMLMNDLALLYEKQKRFYRAEAVHNECLEIKNRVLGADDPDTLATMSNLAVLYEHLGRFEDAEELHARVLETNRRTVPANHPRFASALNYLGRCYLNRGRDADDSTQFDAAAPMLAQSLEIYLQVRGPDHPDTLECQMNLVHVYCELERYVNAEPMLTDLVERLQRLRDVQHPTTLQAMNILGWTYLRQGRLAEAENILAKTLNHRRRLNPRDPETLQVMGNLAITYHRMGKLDQSTQLDAETLALSNLIRGPDHFETLSSMTRLGLGYLETDRASEGQALLEDVFEKGQRLPGAFRIGGTLASSYAKMDDVSKAIFWSEKQVEIGRMTLPADGLQFAAVLEECGTLLVKLEAWAKAEDVLRESLSIRMAKMPDSWVTFNGRSMLGEALCGQRKFKDAESHLIAAYEGLSERASKIPTASKLSLLVAIDRLITFYDEVENVPESNRWRDEKTAVAALE